MRLKDFIKEEYWKVTAHFDQPKPFQAILHSIEGKKLDKLAIKKEEEAQQIVERLNNQACKVIAVERKEVKRSPPPPFITSTLQQDASNKLGFATKRTMMIAQKLYEGIKIGKDEVGLITYMRTDGIYVNDNFIKDTRSMIKDSFGAEYLPANPRKYKSKIKNAQEAHEAIRPTNINLKPDEIKEHLSAEQLKLYTLIWNRMAASQIQPAILEQVGINLESLDKYGLFRAIGSTVKFDGFYKIYRNYTEEDESKLLPNLQEGGIYTPQEILPTQHFTQPPPRFTEASLVKRMEELGIGRPSTYATIISVLQERSYATLDSKKFTPSDRGQFVTTFLANFFKRYVEYDFTANLEEELDKISNYEVEWKKVLEDFWYAFVANIQETDKFTITDILTEIDKIRHLHFS